MPFPNKTFNNNKIAIKAGRKGGKNYTEKQRLAHTLGQWKRHGVSKKCASKVMLMIKSRDFTSADWFKHIDVLEEIAEHEPKFIPVLVNMKKDWAKFVHGEKIKTENVHHIVDWNKLLDNNETSQEADEFKG